MNNRNPAVWIENTNPQLISDSYKNGSHCCIRNHLNSNWGHFRNNFLVFTSLPGLKLVNKEVCQPICIPVLILTLGDDTAVCYNMIHLPESSPGPLNMALMVPDVKACSLFTINSWPSEEINFTYMASGPSQPPQVLSSPSMKQHKLTISNRCKPYA